MTILLTRTSPLATWQANYAANILNKNMPSEPITLQGTQTTGDINKEQPLHAIGGKALFIKTIEDSLLNWQGDLAVHSMKDMAALDTPGLFTICIGERADVRDALVTPLDIETWKDLPQGACIGTSSLRRSALLKRLRPDLTFKAIRGNVETRIKKCMNGDYDAIVLAAAGLHRLNLNHHIKAYFETDELLPAACQGILALQCRADDHSTIAKLQALADPILMAQSEAERSLCHALGGNCQTPIAAYASILPTQQLCLQALVASLDGSTCLHTEVAGALEEASALGQQAGQQLIDQGAERLLR